MAANTTVPAIICTAYGEPEGLALGDWAAAEPAAGEIAIDVAAAGVSFADTLMIQNKHQNKHPLPFVPGMEVAGTIAALGSGVNRFAVGQRVMALVYDGGYAGRAVAKAYEAFPLPDAVDFATAAAVGSIHLTSYIALLEEGRLKAGETVLVLGAAGGVGSAGVEIAKASGATVIAAAGGPEKVAAAIAAGADACIDYLAQDLKARVEELTDGRGVDVVLDPVGGPHFEAALSSVGWGGRYVVVGFAGGAIPQIPANRLLVKNRSAVGMVLMHYRRNRQQILQKAASELFAMAADGRLKPQINHLVPLTQAPTLMRAIMDRKLIGKAVVQI